MLPLPILNVRLNACPEDWQQMTPVALGHHCTQCDRVVLDFTASTQVDLAAAFQNSPDGRVCGRFRPEQLAPRPLLRQKLRRFLVALLLVCGLGLSGQEALAQVRKAGQQAASPQQQPYGYVEQMPVYKGGQEAMMKFMAANVHWPDDAPVDVSGRVFVKFQITETGAVRDVQIVKGLHPALDAEAVRVVKLFDGKFTPGEQNNRPVSVGYTIPIAF
ncbi:energy transducer TonB [Hymenobacter wooponensis]|uniref:Energy transducer TonB n=1 Tax=Hymenobacter wooponensis TaxID=1525360 RepID=A0A4Z0MPS2_9BACT|nr:energy transducer TonB [Hymenobacter wooponensis]TGD81793.1 energy transducer TonB [Hymenobacter wooponensis]